MTPTTPPPGQALTAETVKLLVKGDRVRWLSEPDHYGTFVGLMDSFGSGIQWHSDHFGRDHYSPRHMIEFVKRPEPPREDLGDGVWSDVDQSSLASQSTAPTRGEDAYVGEWQDKAEGLEADLRSAVMVAWKRGATEWCRLNYPQWLDWLEASHTPPEPVASALADGEGLEVVAWEYRTAPHRRWHWTDSAAVAEQERKDGSEVVPRLVRAEAAAARIGQLQSDFDDCNLHRAAAVNRATQAEARADRLARALEKARDQFDFLVRMASGSAIFEIVDGKRVRRKLGETIASEADEGSKLIREALREPKSGGGE